MLTPADISTSLVYGGLGAVIFITYFWYLSLVAAEMNMIENFLVIGLGNPGREYRETRHNVGFMLVDRLAVKLNARFTRLQSRALVASAPIWRKEDHSCQATNFYEPLRSIGAGTGAFL